MEATAKELKDLVDRWEQGDKFLAPQIAVLIRKGRFEDGPELDMALETANRYIKLIGGVKNLEKEPVVVRKEGKVKDAGNEGGFWNLYYEFKPYLAGILISILIITVIIALVGGGR